MQTTRRDFLRIVAATATVPWLASRVCAGGDGAQRPNIIIVLADDLGYGDPGCYNPKSKIPTPNIDKLAAEGMRFTDAHCAAAICTPTRYSLLTGRNPWRGSWRRGVAKHTDGPTIEKGLPTLPGVLKKAGYRTAFVGKWHLGQAKGKAASAKNEELIAAAAGAAGFDDVLKTWPDGIPKDRVKLFREADERIRKQTLAYLNVRRADAGRKPFFFYVNPNNPHDPFITTAKWRGKSKVGHYGDEVMQLDAFLGDIMATLKRTGLERNTLLIFTSDNGPETARRDYTKYPFQIPEDADDRIKLAERRKRFKHDSSGGLNGAKYSALEAGHRVPFIARWPGRIRQGVVESGLVSQTDLLATCAAVAGAELPDAGAEDSLNQLPLFLGAAKESIRTQGVFASSKVESVVMRRDEWTLIGPLPGVSRRKGKYELYNLKDDPAQKKNVGRQHPELAKELRRLLRQEATRRKRRVE